MDIQTNGAKIKEHIEKAKSIIIATGRNPSTDSLGSTLSLYLGLLGLGKSVSVVCPDPVTVEFSNLIGVNKLDTKIGGRRNFVISLDYQEGSIEKVSYNIEGNRFNLVIEPRPGFEDFSAEKVHYSHSGGSADLIIAIGTQKLEDLGSVYEDNKELFAEKPIINIDRHSENAMYGAVNLIDTNASSLTEMIAVVMSYSGVKLSEDIATNLLNTIEESTDRFQGEKVNARTFEIASVCMKAGAKRFGRTERQGTPSAGIVQKDQPIKQKKQGEEENPAQKPKAEDWLKPKIFKNPNTNI